MFRRSRLALASVLALAALGASAPAANAYIYWTDGVTDSIGRANLDGTGVNLTFSYPDFSNSLAGIAVDRNHIYWARQNNISRANLDGTEIPSLTPPSPDGELISVTGFPEGVAVNGNHIYWANDNDTIGRANLDGTGVNQSFITAAADLYGVAVDDNHIYWANYGNNTIGRANLDGTGIDQSFITVTGGEFYQVAVGGSFVYWTNWDNDTIGRANLDGTGANQSFITGANSPYALAVDGNYIYWGNNFPTTIARANLDGTGANQSFITGVSSVRGLAVDSLPNPTISRVGKPTKRSLKVKVGCGDTSACSLRLTGNKVGVKAALVPKTVSVGAGQQPTVTLAYTRALKAALAKGGRVSVTATNPVTGGVKTIVVRVAR